MPLIKLDDDSDRHLRLDLFKKDKVTLFTLLRQLFPRRKRKPPAASSNAPKGKQTQHGQ